MIDRTPVAQAFAVWASAEVAANYAANTTDEAMDALVDVISMALDALLAAPCSGPEDLLLKMFAHMLYENQPQYGQPPLVPQLLDNGSEYRRATFAAVLADLRTMVPAVAAALDVPHRDHARAA